MLLGTGDSWTLKQLHAEIIPMIENGEEKARVQFQAQFPNCPWSFDPKMSEKVLYDDRNKKQIAEVIAKLKTIIETITTDPCTNGEATLSETTKAVAELCQIFTPQKGEIIETGLHFPLGIYARDI